MVKLWFSTVQAFLQILRKWKLWTNKGNPIILRSWVFLDLEAIMKDSIIVINKTKKYTLSIIIYGLENSCQTTIWKRKNISYRTTRKHGRKMEHPTNDVYTLSSMMYLLSSLIRYTLLSPLSKTFNQIMKENATFLFSSIKVP